MQGRNGIRLAAAGLAGALLTAGAAGPVCAAVPGFGREKDSGIHPSSTAGSLKDPDGFWWNDSKDKEEDSEGSQDLAANRSVLEWDEDAILDRWDLDPDDFPPGLKESEPYIQEELVPYFQEVVSDAVGWYEGDTPPEADLSKYSARADAIRRAAEKLKEESQERVYGQTVNLCRSFSSSEAGAAGQDLVSALQGGNFSAGTRANNIGSGGGMGFYSAKGGTSGSGENTEKDTSSVNWFLQNYKVEEGEESDGKEDSDEAGAGDAQESSDHREETPFKPAHNYLVPAPFLYDTDPEVSILQGDDPVTVPIGVYPQTNPYPTAADAEESGEDENPQDSLENGYSGDGYAEGDSEEGYSVSESSGESFSEDGSSYSGDAGLSGLGSGFIPYRYPTGSFASDPEKDEGDTVVPSQRKTLFIGDSRTVGMQMFCGGMREEYWSAKNSMGYSWMVSTGIPNVEYLIDADTDVVILMGVNDLGNVYSYIDYINRKAAEWKKLGARTFFVSVTPVDDRRSPNAKNSRIESFNAYAQENLQDVYYIDAYSRIRYSFGSPDGIHFDGSTYREIYRIINFYLYSGWYEQNGLRFYFDCGQPLTGWQYLDGQWQYMDGYGVRWIRNGRVGDLCVPLPDLRLTKNK